jgi:hypothetical protein
MVGYCSWIRDLERRPHHRTDSALRKLVFFSHRMRQQTSDGGTNARANSHLHCRRVSSSPRHKAASRSSCILHHRHRSRWTIRNRWQLFMENNSGKKLLLTSSRASNTRLCIFPACRCLSGSMQCAWTIGTTVGLTTCIAVYGMKSIYRLDRRD